MGGRSPSHFKAIIALFAAANIASSLAGCGGTVRTDGDVEEPGPNDKDPDPPSGSPAGGGGSGSDHEVDLPPCKLGVKQADAESCKFLYEGRCYEEQLEACACACPRKTGTTCISGLPSDESTTEVLCS